MRSGFIRRSILKHLTRCITNNYWRFNLTQLTRISTLNLIHHCLKDGGNFTVTLQGYLIWAKRSLDQQLQFLQVGNVKTCCRRSRYALRREKASVQLSEHRALVHPKHHKTQQDVATHYKRMTCHEVKGIPVLQFAEAAVSEISAD